MELCHNPDQHVLRIALLGIWWDTPAYYLFLSDPGKPGVRSLGPDVRQSVRHLCVDLTDVTLADEDTNSILTDNANRAIQGNVAMQ